MLGLLSLGVATARMLLNNDKGGYGTSFWNNFAYICSTLGVITALGFLGLIFAGRVLKRRTEDKVWKENERLNSREQSVQQWVENEMIKWKEHMPAMAQGKMGKSPQRKMQRLSDPALGLLLDGNQMSSMMMHHQRGMRGSKQAMMKAMRNPETRAKVKAYAEKNIFPVISKEREALDKVLSKKEKKVIANARLQMKEQKAKMMQIHANGKMAMSDSSRLAMRQQMDKNRVALRQIVLNHYGELQKQLAPIKEKMPQWRADIHNIIVPNRPQNQFKPRGMPHMPAKAFMKERKEMMFLLFDPQHPDSNMFMHRMDRKRKK